MFGQGIIMIRIEKLKEEKMELFYLIYIASLSFAKGFNLFGINKLYLAFALVGTIFLSLHIIINNYSFNDYIKIGLLLAFCLLVMYCSHGLGILMLGITIAGAKDIPEKRMVCWMAISYASAFLFRIALALLGIVDNSKRVEWKFFFRREVTKYGLGFHPNILHAGLFILLVFWLYEKKRMNILELLITQLINVLLFFVSYSVTGFIMCEVAIIGGFVLEKIIGTKLFKNSVSTKVAIYGIEAIPVLLSFLPALYYDPNNWWCYTIKGYTGGRTLWIYEFSVIILLRYLDRHLMIEHIR